MTIANQKLEKHLSDAIKEALKPKPAEQPPKKADADEPDSK